MNIGIIGIGQIGGTIAQKLAQVGHTVKVANSKGIDSVADFAQKIGAIPADLHRVGVDIDVLILSIPPPAIANLPPSLWVNLSPDTVIVDTGNYYPEFRDNAIADIDNGMTESLWVSDIVGRGVVKAFNMLLAHSLAHLGKTKGEPNRLAMWVAGDDESQKQLVMSLVDECGFEPLDAGDLANSWQQQPNSAGYCCDYTADELRQNRAYALGELPKLTGGYFSHDKVIGANRILNV